MQRHIYYCSTHQASITGEDDRGEDICEVAWLTDDYAVWDGFSWHGKTTCRSHWVRIIKKREPLRPP